MKVRTKSIIFNILYPFLAVAVMLGMWWVIAAVKGNALVFPSPVDTFAALGKMLVKGSFWRAIFNTICRTLIAFSVSLVLAAGLAILAKICNPIRRIFAPIVSVLRALPTVAVVLLLVVWSSPKVAPVIVDMLVIMPMLFAAILASIDGVDPELIEMSKVYRVPVRKQIFGLYVPSVTPVLTPQLASTLSLSVKLMVAAEALASTASSLGGEMQAMSAYWETASLFAYTLVAVVVSMALEYGVLLVAKLCKRRAK